MDLHSGSGAHRGARAADFMFADAQGFEVGVQDFVTFAGGFFEGLPMNHFHDAAPVVEAA